MVRFAHRLPVMLITILGLWHVCPTASAAFIDRFAAFINDDVILESDIEIESAFSRFIQPADGNAPVSRKAILEKLINRRLILSEAERFKTIRITDEMITRRSDRIIEKAGGVERWKAFTAAVHLSQEEWRTRVRNTIIFENYVDQRIRAFIQVSKNDVDAYILEHTRDFGVDTAAGKEQVRTDPAIRKLVRKLLVEQAVTKKLAEKTEKLRKLAAIRILETDDPTPLPSPAATPVKERNHSEK